MSDFKKNDRDLVADQPGLGLSFIGLFLAFFVGLAIRATVAPDRVQEHLQQATANIHKDLDFKFEKAYVSFARGFWPDLSVVVENLTVESNQSCWMTPRIEVHEVRLPLSLKHLFRGEILIHEIYADEVNLSLRTAYSACESEKVSGGSRERPATDSPARKVAQAEGEGPKPFGTNFQNVSRKNPIDTLVIESLKIHYLPVAFTSFHIKDFEANLKSEEPRWLNVIGQLVLDGDPLRGDASSLAQLQVDAIEGDHVKASAKGVWREGNYNISAHLDSRGRKFEIAADALHLPLSQMLPLLKKYHLTEKEFNGKRAWLSGHLRMSGAVSEFQKTPVSLEKLKIEGDLGEFTCKQARIHQWQPLQFDPLDFEIRGLNVKELLVFLNRPHPSPALGELGIFNGTARFINPEHVVLRGDYSGLEFIFSNQGVRHSQVLSLVSGEMDLNKQHWDISIDRIKPAEGIFEGKVSMKADKDFKDLLIEAQITELGLAPKVQSLMTGGGSFGALSGQLRTRLKSAQLNELKGQLRWDQLLIEGVKFQKPRVGIQSVQDEIQLNLSAQEMELNPLSKVSVVFSPVFKDHAEGPVLLKNPSAIVKTRKFVTLAWEQFQSQASWGLVKSQGRWDEKSDLSGEIQVQSSKPKTWEIFGTRSQPQLRLRELRDL